MTLDADFGLGGKGQGGVAGGGGINADDARQSQRLMPWEGSTFRTPSVYEMAFCACKYGREGATASSIRSTDLIYPQKGFPGCVSLDTVTL